MTAQRRLLSLVVGAAAVVAAGCTHVYPQPAQTIRVEVADATGQRATGVECRLGNARGTWSMVAPGDVRVINASSELTVTCMRPGAPDGYARLLATSVAADPSRLADPGYLNTFFDPVLNPSVAYPDRVTVVLGKLVVVDRNSQDAAPKSEKPVAEGAGAPKAVSTRR